MKSSTPMAILALKLGLGHKKHWSKIAEMIEINKDDAYIQHWHKDHVVKIWEEKKSSKLIRSDEIGEMLSQRNIEISEENVKETERSENKTMMDYAV